MKIHLGLDDFQLSKKAEVPVLWDTGRLVNAHILVAGKSGVGKTTLLRQLIAQMAAIPPAPRIHVFDVHGDLRSDSACSVRFSEAGECGINPLTISADPHFGGVRKRIQDVVSTLDANHALGARQEAVLRQLLLDLYAANGFYLDNWKSWALNDGVARNYPKKHPTLEDACRFAAGKLKQLVLGCDSPSWRALEELNRTTDKLYKNVRRQPASNAGQDEDGEEKIVALKDKALTLYKTHLDQLDNGKVLDDFIKYPQKDVLKSVMDRLDNLKASGIFKNRPPPFDLNAGIWHYDITALRQEEKRLFVEFRMQEIFARAVERGPLPEEAGLREVIVLDEAHVYFRDNEFSILNTMARESRKFGIGLMCASQSPTHFSDDFFANVATKIVLGVDASFWDGLVRKMKMDPKALQFIRPFHVMGLQMSLKGDARNRFLMVRLNG